MADSIKWHKPLPQTFNFQEEGGILNNNFNRLGALTIETGDHNNFLKAHNSGGGSSTGVEFLLRQVTPGFDETTQTNFALLQMLNNGGKPE